MIAVGKSESEIEARLYDEFPDARVDRNDVGMKPVLERVKRRVIGEGTSEEIAVDLRGTPFQLSVWNDMLTIPAGATRSYGEVARRIGRPKAFRAVAQACGANPVPIVVPCHRVIASGGKLGGYTGGLDRKLALLASEGVSDSRWRVA